MNLVDHDGNPFEIGNRYLYRSTLFSKPGFSRIVYEVTAVSDVEIYFVIVDHYPASTSNSHILDGFYKYPNGLGTDEKTIKAYLNLSGLELSND
jgi:hypothetical protein